MVDKVKVLYAVGHGRERIGQAESFSKYADSKDIEYDWVFSGHGNLSSIYTKFEEYNKTEFKGLSMFYRNGKLRFFKSLYKTDLAELYRNIMTMKDVVSNYDYVISDGEPITAWACKLSNIKCLGIGHESELLQADENSCLGNPMLKFICKKIVPVTTTYVSSWRDIPETLPPMLSSDISMPDSSCSYSKGTNHSVFIYLPHEELDRAVEFTMNISFDLEGAKFILLSDYVEKDIWILGNLRVMPMDSSYFRTLSTAQYVVVSDDCSKIISSSIYADKVVYAYRKRELINTTPTVNLHHRVRFFQSLKDMENNATFGHKNPHKGDKSMSMSVHYLSDMISKKRHIPPERVYTDLKRMNNRHLN